VASSRRYSSRSANHAAADSGASDEVKRLVGVAHDSICLLKHEQGASM
jgi:hypothetical protein